MNELICKICGNKHGNTSYPTYEMMFGSREAFDYFECSQCGCLQIKEIPSNLAKYYADQYYSFSIESNRKVAISIMAKRARLKYHIQGKGFIGWLLSRKYGCPEMADWFKQSKTQLDSRILDVGCGAGKLLQDMAGSGFSNLQGADPFIPSDIFLDKTIKILKSDVLGLTGQYDLIMLHHSFEHMPDPHGVMSKLYELTAAGRYVLLRIPVADSYAWKHYRESWVQLDAPRHLFLHTKSSISLLAKRSGFNLVKVVHDSSAMQFWGSEQYKLNIALNDKRSYMRNASASPFSPEQITDYQRRAQELNKSGQGDQACFYLQKPVSG